MIRADYHFHPNLKLKDGAATARAVSEIWDAFSRQRMDIVIVTEHAYKRPRETFEALREGKRAGDTTFIVPGVECLTREGIDLIAFSRKPGEIYSYADVIRPYGLPLEELVETIASASELYGIIVHPHTPGGTGIVGRAGKETTIRMLEKLGFLEKHNCCLTSTQELLRASGLRYVFPKKYQQVCDTHTAPAYLYPHARIMTVGSDAHHPRDIGDASEIAAERLSEYDYLFDKITTESGSLAEKLPKKMWALVPNGLTTLGEWGRKQVIFG